VPVRDLLVVLLRIVGLYNVILHGASLPVLAMRGYWLFFSAEGRGMAEQMGVSHWMVAELFAPLLPFAGGVLLTVLAPRIALWFYPAAGQAEPGTVEIRGSGLLRAGIRVLGVFALFEATAPLVRLLVIVFTMRPNQEVIEKITSGGPFLDNLGLLVAGGFVGGILLLKADVIASRLERLGGADPTCPPVSTASTEMGEGEARDR